MALQRACDQCGAPAEAHCASCGAAWYCGAVCQRAHWGEHELICGKRAREGGEAAGGGRRPAKRGLSEAERERQQAETLLSRMTVAITGARRGDLLRGGFSSIKGALVLVDDLGDGRDSLPLARPAVELLERTGHWQRYLRQLRSLDFFHALGSDAAIDAWVRAHLTPETDTRKNVTLSAKEFPGLRLRFLSLGSGAQNRLQDPDKLPPANVPALLGGALSIAVTKALFAESVLMWETNFWSVSEQYTVRALAAVPAAERARILSVRSGRAHDPAKEPGGQVVALRRSREEPPLRVWVPAPTDAPLDLQPARALAIAQDLVPRVVAGAAAADIADAHAALAGLTLGGLKSFLQKTIRFRATRVALTADGTRTLSARVMLAVAGIVTACTPGGFVPDLQLYTTGVHALAKRLLVIVYEDTFLPRSQRRYASRLALAAHLTNLMPVWRPNAALLQQWLTIADRALQQPGRFRYERAAGEAVPPYELGALLAAPGGPQSADPFALTSALLDAIGSFGGDKALVRDVAAHWSTARLRTPATSALPPGHAIVMPFVHFVDHHWAPRLVYQFDPAVAAANPSRSAGAPFRALLNRVFDEVTGINPRLPPAAGGGGGGPNERYTPDFEERPFVRAVRAAQWRMLAAMQRAPNVRDAVPGAAPHAVPYALDDAWLAGMVGAREQRVQGRATAIVTLPLNGTGALVAIAKPKARATTAPDPLTPAQEAEARTKVLAALAKGVPVRNVPLDAWRGATLRARPLDDDDPEEVAFSLTLRGARAAVAWQELRAGTIAVPALRDVDLGPVRRAAQPVYAAEGGGGVARNAAAVRAAVWALPYVDAAVLRRLVAVLGTRGRVVALPGVSRAGGAQSGEEAPVAVDVAVHAVLQHLAAAYPAALTRRRRAVGVYDVAVPPLLWQLHAAAVAQLRAVQQRASGAAEGRAGRWPAPGTPLHARGWTPKPHQAEALAEMQARHEGGARGHFVWMTAGLGKTYLVGSYLRWLHATRSALPRHVIVTTPKDALVTVYRELAYFAFRVRVLVPSAGVRKERVKAQPARGGIPPDAFAVAAAGDALAPFTITLVEHDHLRTETVAPLVLDAASEAVVVVDEVHKMFGKGTQRTTLGRALASLAVEMVAMTGTPIVDGNTATLVPWLAYVVPFEVTAANFWAAANAMVAYVASSGVPVARESTELSLTQAPPSVGAAEFAALVARYRALVPPAFGGTNGNASRKEMQAALDLMYDLCTPELVRRVAAYVRAAPLAVRDDTALAALGVRAVPRGAFVVARHRAHQAQLTSALRAALPGVPVYAFGLDGGPLNLDGMQPPSERPRDAPRVVVVTKHQAEGYTLTTLNAKFDCVYPSNNATRRQLDARIDRLSQPATRLYYETLHAGLLTAILEHHDQARTLEETLRLLAQDLN